MISEIRIQNFKSIHDLTLKPGRVTVIIGENGSGKSNILEAIAFAAGAAAGKLDGEYLYNRGVRVADWPWMTSAFAHEKDAKKQSPPMFFRVRDEEIDDELIYQVQPAFRAADASFHGWEVKPQVGPRDLQMAREATTREQLLEVVEKLKEKVLVEFPDQATREQMQTFLATHAESFGLSLAAVSAHDARASVFAETTGWGDFLIYAPENTVLRTPPPEGAIEPLGTRGEGLLRLLQSFGEGNFADRLPDMKERLGLFGWFKDFLVPDEAATDVARLQIHDKWLAQDRAVFDQRSANEGFLYLLFYFTALMSWRTPRFFALDNVDNALNPKLCSALMRQIVELARKYDKQVICTTHNPAILDGLNINDDDQRLYTVQRDEDGHTTINRVRPPTPQPGKAPTKLSAAFLAGNIGGLPDHF